jgi:VWFA-related protein
VTHFPALGWLALAAVSLAQAPQEPTLRVTVNLLQVDAVVTDRKGRHVTDLKTEDFEIRQDGKPQRVTHSTYIRTGPPGTPAAQPKTAPPRGSLPPPVVKREQAQRTIAVIVDDLGLTFESMVCVRQALKTFVDVQMQPGELVAILRTSGDVGALQQLTPTSADCIQPSTVPPQLEMERAFPR